MEQALIPIAFFLTVYGIFFLFVRRKERHALIEKGMTAKIFEAEGDFSPALKYGLLCIGVALGFLIGNILDNYSRLDEVVCYATPIFFFGGVGLIAYYIMAKNRKKEL